MFRDRAMPRINHILDSNARKIIDQSDKIFGTCYNWLLIAGFGGVFPWEFNGVPRESSRRAGQGE
jgi:hypothetical protein